MGPTALLPLRRKVCWGIFCLKNPPASAGREPLNLGTKGQYATSRPPKLLSRAVSGLLTGRNTLRRHRNLIGLSDSALCRRCETEDETSTHIFCECEALASLRHPYLDSFLEPEDIKSISLGAIWNFSKATGLPQIRAGHKGTVY